MKNGFTLIELIVTMAIIGILATVGAASYNTTLQRARDAKRKSDIRAIQAALELYHDQNGRYPISTGWVNSVSGGTVTWLTAPSQKQDSNIVSQLFDKLVPVAYAQNGATGGSGVGPTNTPTSVPSGNWHWISILDFNYIKDMPVDPKNVMGTPGGAPDQSGNYLYGYYSDNGLCANLNAGDYYILAARMESPSTSDPKQVNLTSTCQWPSSNSSPIYAVTNP